MTLPANVFRPGPDDWVTVPGPPGHGERYVAPKSLPMVHLGVNIAELPPGHGGCPLHLHHLEEEHFLVLDDRLTVRELATGAPDYREFALRRHELVAYPPGTAIAHAFFNRTDTPVRFLGLSDHAETEVCEYPDSGKALLRSLGGVGVFGPAGALEAHFAACGDARRARTIAALDDDDRPDHVAGPSRVPERDLGGPFGRPLARLAGARRIFLNIDRLPPGTETGPLHAHTADEEVVLVLEGHPTLRQRRGELGGGRATWPEGEVETATLQPLDFVHWAPGDGVAHHLRNDGAADVLLAVIGLNGPGDVTVFPGRDEVHVRALGRSGAFVPTGYWDGE